MKIDINALSNYIRQIDGNNQLGAGALAEKIAEYLEPALLNTCLSNAKQEPAQSELLEVVLAMRDWIDAVPQDTQLPAMPGFDRDWANAVIEQAQKSEPAQAVPVAGIDRIEQLAQQAYLEYINQLKQDICLGVEYKMEQGMFGKAELAAHKNAQLWLGKHKAFREAAILLKRLEINQ